MLQSEKMSFFDDQQMVRIFNNHVVPCVDGNGAASGSHKPLAVPAVKVFVSGCPHCAVPIHNQGTDIQIGNALLRAVSFKPRSQKPIDPVLRSYPQKPLAILGQVVDCQVLEPLRLSVGAENILLRLHGGRDHQPKRQ